MQEQSRTVRLVPDGGGAVEVTKDAEGGAILMVESAGAQESAQIALDDETAGEVVAAITEVRGRRVRRSREDQGGGPTE
jgi:hypothetical protein